MTVAEAKVDFQQATIDADEYPSFRTPPAPKRLPDGYEDFDWIAPKVDKPQPSQP